MRLEKILELSLILLIFAFPVTARAASVSGVIYHDEDRSSLTHYVQSFDPVDALLPGIEVVLLDGEDERAVVTDEYGGFSFEGVGPGTYFVDVALSGYDCTSNNQALRTQQAIREGHVNIVCMGDSIGNYGPEIPYPTRLAWHFEELADVTLDNIHVGGSRSWEWLPGSERGYFEDRLMPVLPDADLVTITITGNDLDIYVQGLEPPYDFVQILLNFLKHPEYMFDAIPRLVQLLEEIQAVNSSCDIVFVLYPNLANSTIILGYTGELLHPIISGLVEFAIALERNAASEVENIVLADMIAYYGDTWMDPFIVDEVHPSDAGSQDYADQIFQALGGVVVEDKGGFGDWRMVGFYAPDLVPGDDDDSDDDDNDDDVTGDDDSGGEDSDDDDEAGCGC